MTAREMFYQGRYHARKNKKLWFLLWLMNALMAGIVGLPMFASLHSELSHSLSAGPMMDRFNLDFAAECLVKFQNDGPFFLASLAGLALVYLVLTLLTTGGTLAVFASTERRFSSSIFFRGCGAYFWRFFRLLLIALIFYGIFVVALDGILSGLAERLTRSWTQEKYVDFLSWARLLLVFFMFLIVNMIFDYAKVRLVVEEGRSAIMSAFRSIKFVYRNFRRTLTLFLLCTFMAVIVIAIYNPLEQVLPQSTRRWIILVFLLQQIFILARVYVRLTFFSSEVLAYESLRPLPASPPREAESVTTAGPSVGPPTPNAGGTETASSSL